MAEFYPPRLNRFLVRSVQTIAAWATQVFYRLTLETEYDCLQWLTDLRTERVVLLPNHPTFDDPILLFLLSAQLGQEFHFLAAHEQFRGLLGQFFQQMGTYSIRRGMADRLSIGQTLDLLSQSSQRLVIFPEGGCSFQNDTVMPFRGGAIQMALQVISKQAKQGQPCNLYVVPISIKYRYTQNMGPVIEQSLQQLEQALDLPSGLDPYQRLRAIAACLLSRMEQDYGLPSPMEQSWNDRMQQLRLTVLERAEQAVGVSSAPQDPLRERVYRIGAKLEAAPDLMFSDQGQVYPGLGDRAALSKTLFRLLNFDAIYDGYVAENPTSERFLDTLTRFERDVFAIDQPKPKGNRRAYVAAGTPINLADWLPAYQQNRSATITQLTQHCQTAVQTNLDRLSHIQKST